jgi:hypothetical protein
VGGDEGLKPEVLGAGYWVLGAGQVFLAPLPGGVFPSIHIFPFKYYAFIMSKIHIVIGKIIIVLHVLLIV